LAEKRVSVALMPLFITRGNPTITTELSGVDKKDIKVEAGENRFVLQHPEAT
jgi:HSP20 family molecular chaperone IbpA